MASGTSYLLGRTHLFANLTPAYLMRIYEAGQELSCQRDARIFSEADPGDAFYLILEGEVRIQRRLPGLGEEALAILRQGQHFGEMALVDDGARSADAVAHTDCRLFRLGKRAFEDTLFANRDLAYEILWGMVRSLASRLRETNAKMVFLSAAARF